MRGRDFAGGMRYRWGFGGKEMEKLGTHYATYDYGSRIYSPSLCRFLTTDPFSRNYEYESPYSYCLSSPLTSVDVQGKWVKIVICKYWRDDLGFLYEKNKISFRRTSHKDVYIKVYSMKVEFENSMVRESVENTDESDDAPSRITIRRDLTDIEKDKTMNSMKSELENNYNTGYMEIANNNRRRIRSVNVSFQVVSVSENTGIEKAKLFKPHTQFYIGEDIDKDEDYLQYIGLTTSRNRHKIDYDEIGKGTVSHEMLHGLQWSIRRIVLDPSGKRAHDQKGLFERKGLNITNVWKMQERNKNKHE